MSTTLFDLGWDDRWSACAARLDDTSAIAGRDRPAQVVRTDRGRCLVQTAEGQQSAALVPGLQPGPTTGDWVLLDAGNVVRAVLPRRTCVVRGAGRRDARGQVLAANVDVLFVVTALSEAPPLNRLERLLAIAWTSGAQPVVLLTKADLAIHVESETAEVAAIAPGVQVLAVSVVSGLGLAALRAALPRGTSGALIGPSGTGKSSLVNALSGESTQTTDTIGVHGKGRHTSTARELVALPWGAVLLDTPGLRGVQLWDAADGVEQTFADVESLAALCRFADCSHQSDPACAVRAAVADGALPARRLASYERLRREQAWLSGRYDARQRAEQRRLWRGRSKTVRPRIGP